MLEPALLQAIAYTATRTELPAAFFERIEDPQIPLTRQFSQVEISPHLIGSGPCDKAGFRLGVHMSVDTVR
jgi:hypothetical protein